MNRAFSFLASVATRRPWKVLAVWALVMAVAAPFAMRFEDILTSAGWDVGGSDSQKARQQYLVWPEPEHHRRPE